MSEELPKGWADATIGDVAESMKNGIYKPADAYADGGVACLRMYNIDGGRIVWRDVKRMNLSPREVQEYQLLPGDLLVNRVNSRELVGKSAVIPEGLEPCVFESKNIRLRLRRDAVCPEFANYKLLLSGSQHFTHNAQQVVGMASISQPQIAAFELPLPPFAEQQRIVAKLQTLLARVDDSRRRLSKIPFLLKRFRQSILSTACSGLLTSDWRDQHQELRSVTPLVPELLKERLARAETAAQKRRLTAIMDHTEEHDSEQLPDNWQYFALEKVCESFDYGTSAKSKAIGKLPVLRMGNIQDGEIDWSHLVYTSDEEEITKYQLQPLTVLFNRTNSPALVGKTAIYRGERLAIFAGYLIRINPLDNILLPDYLNYTLNTMYARDYCLQVKSDGVSQSNINAQKLGKFELPLPPFSEQQEIVRRVKQMFRLADQLESRFVKANEQVNALTRSILAQAFRGKLVTPEAELAETDGREFESAAQLLVRIKSSSKPVSGNSAGSDRITGHARLGR